MNGRMERLFPPILKVHFPGELKGFISCFLCFVPSVEQQTGRTPSTVQRSKVKSCGSGRPGLQKQ